MFFIAEILFSTNFVISVIEWLHCTLYVDYRTCLYQPSYVAPMHMHVWAGVMCLPDSKLITYCKQVTYKRIISDVLVHVWLPRMVSFLPTDYSDLPVMSHILCVHFSHIDFYGRSVLKCDFYYWNSAILKLFVVNQMYVSRIFNFFDPFPTINCM